jgi:4-hydroxy-3-methylbut-2-enyl diphosphate reductase
MSLFHATCFCTCSGITPSGVSLPWSCSSSTALLARSAIRKAEEELAKGNTLYCLGDIVHNGQECERLKKMGLITINHEEFAQLHDAKVLLRAHGEPPETYAIARTNNIEIIDATCPVVLRLQKRIKQEYDNVPASQDTQIVIYGKNGHAEVLGLVGQTHGKAIVIETPAEAAHLDFTKDIRLYSQTTKSCGLGSSKKAR